MSKYTIGQWLQGFSEQGKSCVWIDGHKEPEESMGDPATWINCRTEANARLIAAAPDLLDVLIELVDSEYDFVSVAQKARAVIAKATNGE